MLTGRGIMCRIHGYSNFRHNVPQVGTSILYYLRSTIHLVLSEYFFQIVSLFHEWVKDKLNYIVCINYFKRTELIETLTLLLLVSRYLAWINTYCISIYNGFYNSLIRQYENYQVSQKANVVKNSIRYLQIRIKDAQHMLRCIRACLFQFKGL